MMKNLARLMNLLVLALAVYFGLFWYGHIARQRALDRIIENLKADTRIAEVLVTESKKDTLTGKVRTTIKFLEYDAAGKPLKPKYFTFSGNIIQFQTLVARFDDIYVERADRLRGKSAYLFMKAFVLNGDKTQEFDITRTDSAPDGYKVEAVSSAFQDGIWRRFWRYALEPSERGKVGIKNVQIEAPGTLFAPGTIYTLRIEHDGGVRIDTKPIPAILRGERIN
jgi:hypothetical protein